MNRDEVAAIKNYIYAYTHKVKLDSEGFDSFSKPRHDAWLKLRHATDALDALIDGQVELNQSSMQIVPTELNAAMYEELNSKLGDHWYGTAQDLWDTILEISRKEQLNANDNSKR